MQETDSSGDTPPTAQPKRKPYEAPAIEETSEFETLSLACGKQNPVLCYGLTYANS